MPVTIKNGLCLILIFLILTCTSCMTEEKLTKETNKSVSSTTTSRDRLSESSSDKYHIKLTDNMIVDADIDKPNISHLPVLQADNVAFDAQKLCKVFLGLNGVKGKKIDNYTNEYTDSDKKLTTILGTRFIFSTIFSGFIESIINDSDNGNINAFKAESLEFMPKQKAIDQITNILKSLDISVHVPPIVYSLDYQTLNQEQNRLLEEDEGFKEFVNMGKIKLKDKWVKDDECYYMIFKTDVHGLTCDPIGYIPIDSGIKLEGSKIKVIFSKKGIEACSVNDILYKEKSSKDNEVALITVDQALDCLKQKYEKIITTGEIKVTGISLIYTPVLVEFKNNNKTIELVPAWFFKMQQKENKGNGVENKVHYTYIRINAINGKEIL